MDKLIHFITPDNFNDEVINKKIFLLLCMPHDEDYISQKYSIELIAKSHLSWLDVGLVVDDYIQYFKQKLNITGTPTFLIYVNGTERFRLLGHTDDKSLEQYLTEVRMQIEGKKV